MVARLVAKPLGERLGQPVTVDNKPGAGGNIAAEMATKAPADGYTLILLPSGHASSAAMKKVLPFDPVNDFSWISTLTTYPLSMVVKPDSPIRSFPDFAQRIKAEPGKYTYTSVGVGTAMHLVGEWLMAESGGSATHVPFRGGTAPLTELLAGRVDVVIDTMTSTAPNTLRGARPGDPPISGLRVVPSLSSPLICSTSASSAACASWALSRPASRSRSISPARSSAEA